MTASRKSALLTIVLFWALAGSAVAQGAPPSKSQCRVISSEGSVRILVCPVGLAPEALRVAGQEACGLQVTCNAWIWDAAEKAPRNAPKTDAEIDKNQASDALGVWANDSKTLMLLRRVDKK